MTQELDSEAERILSLGMTTLERLDEPLTPAIARRLRTLTRLPIPGLG